jgi:hypothetical protein
MMKIFNIIFVVLCLNSLLFYPEFNYTKIENINNSFTLNPFSEFIQYYSQDTVFQLERTIFPFNDCSVLTVGDSVCSELIKENWIHLKLIDSGQFVRISNKFKIINYDINVNNKKIISIENLNSRTASFYFFTVINNKWYLERRLSYE